MATPSVPFLSAAHIEIVMARELAAFGSAGAAPDNMPLDSAPVDRGALEIEMFLERHLGVDLDLDATLPDEVLGEVVFRRGRKTSVGISARLTREKEWEQSEGRAASRTAIGRWRMTLAHEAAHVILHESLFDREMEGIGALEGDSALVQRCYKREVSGHAGETGEVREEFCDADFARESALFEALYGASCRALARATKERARLEWQANRGAAALLMPEKPFRRAARALLHHAQTVAPNFSHAQLLEWRDARLATQFGVSLYAASVRARTLGIETMALK